MQFLYKFGNLFGWLAVIFFGGTILNYVLKFINKKWGKKLSSSPSIKSILALLMKIFVKNHRIWGFLAFFALMIHFLLQFFHFGISLSGAFAAGLLIVEVLLGMYAVSTKKPRKGAWFIIHRTIAVLLIVGVVVHIQLPFSIQKKSSVKLPTASEVSNTTTTDTTTTDTSASSGTTTTSTSTTTETSSSTATTKEFTLDELKTYNGKNGQPAYVAYKNVVYDVSDVPQWKNGSHQGETAGTDITSDMSKSPHGDGVLANVPVVGTLKN